MEDMDDTAVEEISDGIPSLSPVSG